MSEQTNFQAPVKRTAEFVLGLLGGIFGIFAGFSGLLFGGLGAALEADGAGEVIGSSWAVILLSALAIVGACIVKKHTKLAGTFYIAAAIGGTVGVSLAYIVPLILLLYVIVTVNIENKSDKDISYNPLDFQIQNEDGQITHNTYALSDDNQLSSGNLTKDGKVSGTIAFQTKKSKTYKVIFTSNFWNDEKITFNLQ